MQGRNGDTDVENGLVDTMGEGDRTNLESRDGNGEWGSRGKGYIYTHTHTHTYTYIYVYIIMMGFCLKPTQHCKAIILQLKE